jgi:hypothetical protein
LAKQKILYVLGHGYSGSTLLALALGTLRGVTSLGEVANLEHDYIADLHCSCQIRLGYCTFWSRIKTELAYRQRDVPIKERWLLEDAAGRELIDARGGGLKKLLLVMGWPLRWFFGSKNIARYERKNIFFLKDMFAITNSEILVDLSKSPERLEVFRKSEDIDIYCLYLKRKPAEVYASNLKRPKKTRAQFGFKVWREAIWYALRTRSYNRTYNKLVPQRKRELNWSEFTQNPSFHLNEIATWLQIEARVAGNELIIKPAEQHIYVGNRWLHWEKPQQVVISQKMSNKKLTPRETKIFRCVLFFFGLKTIKNDL